VNPAEALLDLLRVLPDTAVESNDQLLRHLLQLHFFKRASSASQDAAQNFEELATDRAELVEWRQNHMAARAASRKSSRLGNSIANYFVGLDSLAQRRKPVAVVFTCSFGGGHLTAAKAVEGYLRADGYDVSVIDTTRNKAFISLTDEVVDYFYNRVILRGGWHQLFNLIDRWMQTNGVLVQPCPAPTCDNARKDQFRSAVARLRPEMMVTVYHMDLMPVLELAKEMGNLPLLHIGTDLDLKMQKVFEVKPIYPKFKVGVPFHVDASWQTLSPLSASQAFLSGYPVRKAFLAPRNDSLIKQQRLARFPAGARLVLIMSGSTGRMPPWPELLADNGLLNEKTHVVVIAGANDQLEAKLQGTLKGRVLFQPAGDGSATAAMPRRMFLQGASAKVTLEVAKDIAAAKDEAMPYFVSASELAFLMDMADLVITKPGGASTAEAAYRGVPMVFDSSDAMLNWEAFNTDLLVNASQGVKLTSSTAAALEEACSEALRLGRPTAIATDPETHLPIDTALHVRQAAEEVRTTACDRCTIFGSDALET
jgi:UDP-N-acetylglucosamine:LPS N-acetylglucosamine transferase